MGLPFGYPQGKERPGIGMRGEREERVYGLLAAGVEGGGHIIIKSFIKVEIYNT